jgi:hypothetical protein
MTSKLSSALIIFTLLLIGGVVIEFWLETGLWSWGVLSVIVGAVAAFLQRK